MKPSLSLSTCVLSVSLAVGQASAVAVVDLGRDVDINALIESGSESPIAEARIGNNASNGDWELGVGTNTQSSTTMSNTGHVWVNDATEMFTLAYDGTNLSLTVGSDSTSFNVGTLGPDLILAPKSVVGSEAELSNVKYNGSPLGVTADALSREAFAELDHVLLLDASSVPFTITGDLRLKWDAGNFNGTAKGSRLEFIVKGGDFIPEPGSLVLLATGLLALGRRRRV